jgi:hypothetical protein
LPRRDPEQGHLGSNVPDGFRSPRRSVTTAKLCSAPRLRLSDSPIPRFSDSPLLLCTSAPLLLSSRDPSAWVGVSQRRKQRPALLAGHGMRLPQAEAERNLYFYGRTPFYGGSHGVACPGHRGTPVGASSIASFCRMAREPYQDYSTESTTSRITLRTVLSVSVPEPLAARAQPPGDRDGSLQERHRAGVGQPLPLGGAGPRGAPAPDPPGEAHGGDGRSCRLPGRVMREDVTVKKYLS